MPLVRGILLTWNAIAVAFLRYRLPMVRVSGSNPNLQALLVLQGLQSKRARGGKNCASNTRCFGLGRRGCISRQNCTGSVVHCVYTDTPVSTVHCIVCNEASHLFIRCRPESFSDLTPVPLRFSFIFFDRHHIPDFKSFRV